MTGTSMERRREKMEGGRRGRERRQREGEVRLRACRRVERKYGRMYGREKGIRECKYEWEMNGLKERRKERNKEVSEGRGEQVTKEGRKL